MRPAVPLPAILAEVPARAEPPLTALPTDLRGSERILVLDDDPHVRKTLGHALTLQGYQVASASTEVDALKLLEQHTFDVLLTDVFFGASSGPDLAEKARLAQPELRTLFMTGYARGVAPSLTGPALLKPFAVAELLAALRRLLG